MGTLEVRRIGAQDFLSPERDLLTIFLPMCKAALISTDEMMADLSDDDLKKELKHILDSIKAYRDSIYTEDVSSYEISRRLWDVLSSTRGGKLFLANLSFDLLDMFVDASRRSVQKPDLDVESMQRALVRDRALAALHDDIREKVSEQLTEINGFGEFVPGMYKEEKE